MQQLNFAVWSAFYAERRGRIRPSAITLTIALVAAVLAVPPLIAQHTATQTAEEEQECTAYPEYYCYPSGRPAQPVSSAAIAASQQAAADAALHPPACTVYPEYSCPGTPESTSTAIIPPVPLDPATLAWYAVYTQACGPYPEWSCDQRTLESLDLSQPPPSRTQ